MITIEPMLGAGILSALKEFVNATKLHPVLVNFTTALVPVSVFSDFAGRVVKSESLRNAAWWTLFYATAITPFTAITGWLFWMPDDNGVAGMTIHKWLGSGLVLLLFGLFVWRWNLHMRQQWPTPMYFVAGVIFISALVYQGHLGGQQVFSGM
ncbi:MAG TPA: DUF2231 domain-containing protein [Candidatus Saccharimonadales bacterium]|nr:DUF2231 domain-containing protein [Candidatus Saccharimonadales bacterium]